MTGPTTSIEELIGKEFDKIHYNLKDWELFDPANKIKEFLDRTLKRI